VSVILASVKESIPHLLLSNRAEMTDPYDLRFRVVNTHKAYDSKVDPSKPDTDKDGNGYWDGWIGVYNVSYDYDRGIDYAENVVLYREHLSSGRLSLDEIVQEQARTHSVDEAPSAMGADGQHGDIHSNVHIGELQWEASPTNGSETPEPSVEIEVDYHADSTGPVQNDQWREAIVNNYAMYGIEIDFVDEQHTDTLDGSDLSTCIVRFCLNDHRQPFTVNDIYWIQDNYQDTDSLYLFVGNVTDDPNEPLHFPEQGGIRRHTGDRDETTWVSVFMNGNTEQSDFQEIPAGRWGISRNEQVRSMTLKTTVHELGHVLNMGEVDDNGNTEVYSGGGSDATEETILDRAQGGIGVEEWSVMSGGTEEDQFLPPTNETYFALSLEELMSASTNDWHVEGR